MEVVGWLRRWLVEEGRNKLLGSWSYTIRAEDVALVNHGDDWTAVIQFRLDGDVRRYGFAVGVAGSSDPDVPRCEPPDLTAETVLILLDEAILTSRRTSKPDEEGVVWLT